MLTTVGRLAQPQLSLFDDLWMTLNSQLSFSRIASCTFEDKLGGYERLKLNYDKDFCRKGQCVYYCAKKDIFFDITLDISSKIKHFPWAFITAVQVKLEKVMLEYPNNM